MKQWGLLLLVIFVVQKQGILLGAADEDGFVTRKGIQFMLNGSPFYSNGFNAYWLMYFATNPSERNKVSSVFQEAKDHGLVLARTWAFNDGQDQDRALQYSPGSYNEQSFQGLDFVITEAKRYGIKLVLSLVNNYENFGGRRQYVEWARNQGQSLSSDDDFFTNSVVKDYYKNHIKTVLTRRNSVTGVEYKDDPTIMAWELMNEPRCVSDPSGRTLQAWITEMASYLKSVDGNHLLEIGLEGFYGQSSQNQQQNLNSQVGTDFIANNQIPEIDFATVHSYPDQWLPNVDEAGLESFLNEWLNNHIQDAQNILQKPVLFAEFGKSSTSGYSKRDEFFNTVYAAIYSSARGGGAAAGGMFWQLFTDGMDSFRDGYEVVFNQNPSTAGIILDQSNKLNHIRKMYVKLRNIEKWNRARIRQNGKWKMREKEV